MTTKAAVASMSALHLLLKKDLGGQLSVVCPQILIEVKTVTIIL
jgi:hypothetical protein